MGLSTVVANAIESGFKALGASDEDGLQVSVAYYRQTSSGVYNPSTGTTTPTEELSTIDAIFYAERNREVDGIKIDVHDRRLIFPTSRVSFDPTTKDRVEIGTDTFNVVDAYQDPAQATWTLHIRGT